MVALARKAFFGRVPFPLIHIDNGIDFPETYELRERLAKEWDLDVLVARSVIKDDISGHQVLRRQQDRRLAASSWTRRASTG